MTFLEGIKNNLENLGLQEHIEGHCFPSKNSQQLVFPNSKEDDHKIKGQAYRQEKLKALTYSQKQQHGGKTQGQEK